MTFRFLVRFLVCLTSTWTHKEFRFFPCVIRVPVLLWLPLVPPPAIIEDLASGQLVFIEVLGQAARGSGAEVALPEARLVKRDVELRGARRREWPAAAMNIVNEIEEEAERPVEAHRMRKGGSRATSWTAATSQVLERPGRTG